MRRQPAIAVVVLLALLAFAAAVLRARFASPRVEPMVTASGRALTGFCAAAVQLHCNKRVECGQMHRRQLNACIDEVGAECERSLGWKLRAGVLTVIGGEPQEECLEAMGDAGCNALQFLLGDDEPGLLEITDRCEIEEMFHPHSGIGAACAETSDCTAGFCPGLAAECHRCRPFVGPGEACKPGEALCDPARAFCAAASDGMKCRPLLPDGASCTDGHACRGGACRKNGDGAVARSCAVAAPFAPCASLDDCGDGFYCRLDGGRRACAPRVKTGEPCDDDSGACAEAEARCVAGRCRVRPFVLRAGALCHDFSDCKDGLYCKGSQGGAVAGRCAAQAGAGAKCQPLDFGACRVDSTCFRGRCRQLGAAGESCAGPYRCKAFLSCVPTSPDKGFSAGALCVPNPLVGQACTPHLPCVAGFCDGTTGNCVALAAGGARCRSSEQCESGWCVGSADAGVCYSPCLK